MLKSTLALIIPIRNESSSLSDLLNSIESQSCQPDEIIIIDTGSHDNSTGIIIEAQKKNNKIKILYSEGSFPGKARNVGIKSTNADIIVHIDGGCIVADDWLKKLITPILQNRADFVTGNVEPSEIKAKFFGKNFDLGWFIHSSINPAIREKWSVAGGASIAYKRWVWEKVGGQPEFLRVAEDVCFAQKVKKLPVTTFFAEDSLCYWQVGPHLKDSFRRKHRYIYHELQLNFFTSQLRAAFIRIGIILLSIFSFFINPFISSLILIIGILYWVRFAFKATAKYTSTVKSRILLSQTQAFISFFMILPITVIVETSAIFKGLYERLFIGKLHKNIQHYLESKSILLLFFIIFILPPINLYAKEWNGLRDGILHIRVKSTSNITVKWKPTWLPGAFSKTIYIQHSNGALFKKIILNNDNLNGSINISLSPDDYKFELPGPCFYEVSVFFPDNILSMWEPAKIHPSLTLPANKKFYFNIINKNNFYVFAKSHYGLNSFNVTDPDGKKVIFQLSKVQESSDNLNYNKFDSLLIHSPIPGIWSLENCSDGKGSFWLNTQDNYFTLDTNSFFNPEIKKGSCVTNVKSNIIGSTPLLGGYLPETEIPSHGYQELKKYSIKAATFYANEDLALKSSELTHVTWYNLYNKNIGIDRFFTLFSMGRSNLKNWLVSGDEKILINFLGFTNKLALKCLSENKNSNYYFTFYDEPNPKFNSIKQYVDFYKKAKFELQKINIDKKIKFAGPETSGFLQGTNRPDSKLHFGISYTEELLKDNWNNIDAISWHQWGPFDLIATEEFYDAVTAAAKISERYRPKGAKNKELIISQTNIASGPHYSSIQQDSFFAALWFASVVIQCGREGKLTMLNWFPFVGMKDFKKGILEYESGQIRTKPIGNCFIFLNKHLQPMVLNGSFNSIDIESLPTCDSNQTRLELILVNKSRRPYDVSISINQLKGFTDSLLTYSVDLLGKNLEETHTSSTIQNNNKTISLKMEIKPESIYALSIHNKNK